MGRFVIVAYAPKQGQEQPLLDLVTKHMDVLKAEDLVTQKSACIMRASNGSIVEVFEWKSPGAIQRAHQSPAVQALWQEFESVCEYVPLRDLSETEQLFAEFDSVE